MKKFNLADGLALILLILQVFAPYFANSIKVNPNVLIMLINCYIIAYISYIISFTDTKKVLLMALPLLIYTGFIIFFLGAYTNPNVILNGIVEIFSKLFDVMMVSFVFFIIELILNRIGGAKFSVAMGILSLAIYLVIQNTTIIPFDFYYKDLLVYYSFFVMAARIKPATNINKLLYPLAILLLIGEIIAYSYYKIYPGIYFSLYLFTYVILKDMTSVEGMNELRYLSFAYLYPYWPILVVLNAYIKASPLVVSIMAVLITYVLSHLIYKLRLKFLDYLYVGVH